MDVLREAGICRPVFRNYAGLWGIAGGAAILDMLADAVSVPFGNQPANQPIGRSHADGNSVNEMIRMELESMLRMD
ncbi:hypothetical protein [Parasulfitobacter algicola]|uniref:Uncharacterized protein n=1 Tax=Parasulfitobacter algicola TaxID=2614809 RepID=A0ABX2IK81_9RHOB|nr:hypothetical protein [Sulfitobacter algicola]NSX53284.1 hypothetical protein [Sulfitobacter algicola]